MATAQSAAEEPQTIAQHSKRLSSGTPNDSLARRNRITEMLVATAEVMGTELSAPALNLFVEDLIELPDEVIARALVRCRREIRGKNGFPPTPTIADVLDRAGVVSETQVEEAECRAAWDVLLRYASKYIVSNVHGGYEEKHYFGQSLEIPQLPDRIKASLRRCGGWQAIKRITNEDMPFIQRRFFEEFRAWNATEAALSAGVLSGNQSFAKLLESRAMPGPKRIAAPPCAALPEPEEVWPVKPKVQAINSKEELRKQAAELAFGKGKRVGKRASPPT